MVCSDDFAMPEWLRDDLLIRKQWSMTINGGVIMTFQTTSFFNWYAKKKFNMIFSNERGKNENLWMVHWKTNGVWLKLKEI